MVVSYAPLASDLFCLVIVANSFHFCALYSASSGGAPANASVSSFLTATSSNITPCLLWFNENISSTGAVLNVSFALLVSISSISLNIFMRLWYGKLLSLSNSATFSLYSWLPFSSETIFSAHFNTKSFSPFSSFLLFIWWAALPILFDSIRKSLPYISPAVVYLVTLPSSSVTITTGTLSSIPKNCSAFWLCFPFGSNASTSNCALNASNTSFLNSVGSNGKPNFFTWSLRIVPKPAISSFSVVSSFFQFVNAWYSCAFVNVVCKAFWYLTCAFKCFSLKFCQALFTEGIV